VTELDAENKGIPFEQEIKEQQYNLLDEAVGLGCYVEKQNLVKIDALGRFERLFLHLTV